MHSIERNNTISTITDLRYQPPPPPRSKLFPTKCLRIRVALEHTTTLLPRGGGKGRRGIEDSQRRFLAQLSVATLLRHCFEWLQHCSNIAMRCCTKNCRCESSRVTSPLQLKTTTGELKYFALDKRATKNHPGGISDLEDETQSVVMAWPANPRCPVACLEKYLAKRDPRCDAFEAKTKLETTMRALSL